MKKKKKLIRITTVASALAFPLKGQPSYMHENGYDVIMISAAGWSIDKVLQQEICPHIAVNLTRKITPMQDLGALIKLIKIFREHKPDIIHTETPKAGLLGMLAARICNVKVRIHTVAGLPLMVEKGFKFWLLKWIEKITYAAATDVWPNSLSLQKYIVRYNLAPADKLRVIGKGSSNGINLERFNNKSLDSHILQEIKSSISYDEKYIYLLFIGRLVLDKGIVELINVFTGLHSRFPNLRMILAGPFEKELDPLPSFTEAEIKTNPAIIHIEWTDHSEYYMSISNFFVFPSYREGFPNVLLEAGAISLPIVCSNIPGNIDIVSNMETGLTFINQNEADFMKVMKYALSNTFECKKMAYALQKIVVNNFARDTIWKAIMEQYNILSEKR